MPTVLPIAALLDVISGIVMALFTVSALLLTIVILLQEGKGGGLAGAFGGAGAETFGVKAGTVNKFTAWLGAAFLGLALLYAGMQQISNPASIESTDDLDTSRFDEAVETPGDGDAGGGSEDGAGDPGDGDPGDGDE
jgi:preprotein translocase subunit SecG